MSVDSSSSPNPTITPIARVSAAAPAAAWRKMVGIALLWVALATLAYMPQAGSSLAVSLIALPGFLAFAAGLSLFAEGLKQSIVAEVSRRLSA